MGRHLVLTAALLLAGVTACRAPREDPANRPAGGAPEFRRIPAGTFDMGCVPGDDSCSAGEKPRHRVTISRDFWMMRTEASVGEYKKFAAATRRSLPDGMQEPFFNEGWKKESHPMVGMSSSDASAYCQWVGGRLPTEAEWEYAARGGRAGWKYVWGNEPIPLVDGQRHANVADESGKKSAGVLPIWVEKHDWFHGYDDGYPETAPVGSFAPNGFGLHDMGGNVSEWCSDWYAEEYYSSSPAADPHGPSDGGLRVVRGGSFSTVTESDPPKVELRVSQRDPRLPELGIITTGFRCARDTPGP